MTPDPILTVEEHDSAMGEVARGGAWTPLVDHDTALRARAEAAEARVADLTDALTNLIAETPPSTRRYSSRRYAAAIDAARAVLAGTTEPPKEPSICPHCGSTNVPLCVTCWDITEKRVDYHGHSELLCLDAWHARPAGDVQ